jgi:hypothetical protein
MMDILLALTLIVLHSVDGFELFVNPEHIIILRPTSEAARGTANQLIAKGHACVIGLSDGKFVSVVESCGTVRDAINQNDINSKR